MKLSEVNDVLKDILKEAKHNMTSDVCPKCSGFKFFIEMICRKCWHKECGLEFKGHTSDELRAAIFQMIKRTKRC